MTATVSWTMKPAPSIEDFSIDKADLRLIAGFEDLFRTNPVAIREAAIGTVGRDRLPFFQDLALRSIRAVLPPVLRKTRLGEDVIRRVVANPKAEVLHGLPRLDDLLADLPASNHHLLNTNKAVARYVVAYARPLLTIDRENLVEVPFHLIDIWTSARVAGDDAERWILESYEATRG